MHAEADARAGAVTVVEAVVNEDDSFALATLSHDGDDATIDAGSVWGLARRNDAIPLLLLLFVGKLLS